MDYTIEFEPVATALELEGAGKVVASLGVESGKVPYTAFSVKKCYLEKNPDVIQSFTNAIQKGLEYVVLFKANKKSGLKSISMIGNQIFIIYISIVNRAIAPCISIPIRPDDVTS